MRYKLDSDLPIHAFSPRGGRSPFARGMTLEGGDGGGGILSGVTDAIGGVVKGVTDVVKGVVQPVYNATLKQIPGVDNALVNLDKSVGKTIPGGWGTVATVASSFVPGMTLPMKVGLGALSGSGVMRTGNKFNLQGAIMGGALAYGGAKLTEGFANAATEGATQGAAKTGSDIVADAAIKPGSGYVPEGGMGTGSTISSVPQAPLPPPGAGIDYNAGLSADAVKPYVPPPSFAERIGTSINNVPSNIESGLKSFADSGTKFFDAATSADTYKGIGNTIADKASGTFDNMGKAVTGAGNVIFGNASLPSGTLLNAGIPMVIGASGLAALDEQQKQLDQQLATGNIAQEQYNSELAKIEEQRAFAQQTVNANPLKTASDQSNISQAPTLYAGRSRTDTLYDTNPKGGSELLYAMGGTVSNPPDDQTGMPNQSPMTNFEQGGMYGLGGMAPSQPMSYPGYAAGGMAPRFLSGGGDGMSDSIPANIGGHQEARLADGEFVVPADVVSHLGNGSSKAGAKQLYSMMDKVRQARTGRKSQGKQINPRKYLAA
jgi:hypothetical protein